MNMKTVLGENYSLKKTNMYMYIVHSHFLTSLSFSQDEKSDYKN